MSAPRDLGPTYTQDNVPEEVKSKFRRPDGTYATTQQVPQQQPQLPPYTSFPPNVAHSPYRLPPGTTLNYGSGISVPVPYVRSSVVPSSLGVPFYPSSPSQLTSNLRTTPSKIRDTVLPPVSANKPPVTQAPNENSKEESDVPPQNNEE